MTKQEFLDSFFLHYTMDNLNSPGVTPLEISNYASKIVEELVIQKYKDFEVTEKLTEDLGELVRYKTFNSFTNLPSIPNSVYITLPNTLLLSSSDFSDVYWFTIYEDCLIDKLDCSGTNTNLKATIIPVTHGELKVALSDPFRKPYYKNNKAKVLRARSENRTQSLSTDGTFNITSYTLGYIKRPLPIDLTTSLTSQFCELSNELHKEVLDKTILKIKEINGEFVKPVSVEQ